MFKVYIAGKITGNQDYKAQFTRAEKEIEKLGLIAINPVEPEGFEYKEYIDMGLSKLKYCDFILMLPSWVNSEGAKLEEHYARTCGIEVCYSMEHLELRYQDRVGLYREMGWIE